MSQDYPMKKMMPLTIATFIGFILASQQTLAADIGKFYVGVEIGSAHVSGDGPEDGDIFAPKQNFKASDASYGLHAGFQFNDWFATEIGFTDFGNAHQRFKLKDGVVFVVQPNDTQIIDAKGISLSGVFSYKIAANLALFGVLGVTGVNYDTAQSGGFSPITGSLLTQDSFSDQGLLYGLGAKYALSDSFNLRADLRRNHVGDFNLDVASLGLEYTF